MTFFHLFDIIGIVAFSISGSLVAMRKRLDPFGVFIIAFATAVGGGTLRDILIGANPVFWMKNTLIPLDIIFFDVRGIIKKIYVGATPLSQKKIFGGSNLIGALEITGNLTSKLGFSVGDSIQFNLLDNKNAVWPCY